MNNEWQPTNLYPACYVVNSSGDEFVDGFVGYGAAQAFIRSVEDDYERAGQIPPPLYIVPCKPSPGGTDIR